MRKESWVNVHKNYSASIDRYLHQYSNDIVLTNQILEALAGQREFGAYLDVGCGPGHKSMPFARLAKQVTLLELLPEYKAILSQRFPDAEIIIDSINHVDLASDYDVILFSQNLYYHPVSKWFGLCQKLFAALRQDGMLLIIMNAERSDWGRLIAEFQPKLSSHLPFHYMPLSQLIEALKTLSKINIMTYQVQNFYPSKPKAIESLTKQVLNFQDEEGDQLLFAEVERFVTTLPVINGQIIFNQEVSLIALCKL